MDNISDPEESDKEDVQFIQDVAPTLNFSSNSRFKKLLFFIFGFGLLFPFNIFITANGYFKYKFQPQPQLSKRFENVFAIASQLPAVIGNALSLYMTGKVSGSLRIIGNLIIITICLIFTAVLVYIDTSAWTEHFYYLTVGLIVVVNFSSGIYSASICGVAGVAGEASIQALFVGVGGGAVGATLADILSLVSTRDIQRSAVGYFITGAIVTLACVACYVIYLRIYRPLLDISQQQDQEKLISTNDEPPHTPPMRVQIWAALRQIYGKVLLLGYVFVVSVSVFPAVISNIESVNKSTKSPWNNEYFSPFVCFLLLNFSDTCGRWTTGYVTMDRKSRLLPLLVILRTGFIPLFMLCNYQPRSNLPVLLSTDIAPIVLVPLLGFSNGFLQSVCVLHAQQAVGNEHKEITGEILQMVISLACPLGAAFSFAVVAFI